MEIMDIKKILKFYRGKRILITGHTGFKGSWLSYILDYVGSEITGFSLKPNTEPSLFKSLNFTKKFNSIIGDIRDKDKLREIIKNFKPEFIFHLAAQPLVIESYQNPKDTFDVNFTGTLNLLEILRELNLSVQVIFVTTDKVYENLELGVPFIETDKLGGKDPYSASKAASEILIDSYNKSFFKDSNINIASARAGNVIGGGDWSQHRLLPDIIRSCFENSELVIRNSNSVRPWQHVLDPILGYLDLARKLSINPKVFKGAWNFGPNEKTPISVNDIIDIFKTKQELSNIKIEDDRSNKESKYLQLDISKSKTILNWKPRWSSEIAVEYTIKWYTQFYKNISANQLIIGDLKKYLK
jgi:CDP-glucose 4,6-dehydratase